MDDVRARIARGSVEQLVEADGHVGREGVTRPFWRGDVLQAPVVVVVVGELAATWEGYFGWLLGGRKVVVYWVWGVTSEISGMIVIGYGYLQIKYQNQLL